MRIAYPPLLKVFGTGAPGVGVPTDALYFDTSTSPYTPYIYTGGAWHTFGGSSGGGNATSIQGVAVSATAPLSGQILQYNGTVWAPANSAAGPTVVQSGVAVPIFLSSGLSLGVAPTQNNLLVSLSVATGNQASISYGTGWTGIPIDANAGAGGSVFAAWKIAGAGETALQQPYGSPLAGILGIFEMSNAASSIVTKFLNITASTTTNNYIAQKIGGRVLGLAADNSQTVLPTSITGAAQVGTATGQANAVNISGAIWVLGAPAQGNNSVTVNYGSSQGITLASLAIN